MTFRQQRERFLTMANGMDQMRSRAIEWDMIKERYISSMRSEIEYIEGMVAVAVEDLQAGYLSAKAIERLALQINFKHGNDGDSTLMKACRLNLPHAVRDLLKFPKLDVNYRNPVTGDTAIYICIFSNSVECFIELIKSGRIDVNQEDKESKKTPAFSRVSMRSLTFTP